MSIIMKNIKKQYEQSSGPVMENFNLTINDGSFTVLLGPSGCGKTTALRMIAGLEEVTEGTISIDEEDITDVDPGQRNLAMVFQNYAIYPHLSVRGNIEFGLKNYKISKEDIKTRVDYVLKMCGIKEYENRKPNQLSGGQRQRVALARAISKSPKAFLMDEPLSNLDAKLRNQMRSEMIQLYNNLKCTFVYVTHDQTEAMTMGTDIVVIYKGKVMQKGTPREIYNNPANLFVAQFIGDPGMNVIKLKNNGFIGFKPRSVLINHDTDGFNFDGKVLTCEYLGYENILNIDIKIGTIVVRSNFSCNCGETVSVNIPENDFYYFDENQNRTDIIKDREAECVFNVDR